MSTETPGTTRPCEVNLSRFAPGAPKRIVEGSFLIGGHRHVPLEQSVSSMHDWVGFAEHVPGPQSGSAQSMSWSQSLSRWSEHLAAQSPPVMGGVHSVVD